MGSPLWMIKNIVKIGAHLPADMNKPVRGSCTTNARENITSSREQWEREGSRRSLYGLPHLSSQHLHWMVLHITDNLS
jgi:hypothetical protein